MEKNIINQDKLNKDHINQENTNQENVIQENVIQENVNEIKLIPYGIRTRKQSESMEALMDYNKRLYERLRKVEERIMTMETSYLDETPYGNIIKGWEGYLDHKTFKRDQVTAFFPRKIQTYPSSDRIFSNSAIRWTDTKDPLNILNTEDLNVDKKVTITTPIKNATFYSTGNNTNIIQNNSTLRRKSGPKPLIQKNGSLYIKTNNTNVVHSNYIASKIFTNQRSSEDIDNDDLRNKQRFGQNYKRRKKDQETSNEFILE